MDKLRRRDGWHCTPLSHAEGAAFIRVHHYAQGCSNTSVLAMGLHRPSGELCGAALWMPPAPGPARWDAKHYGVESSRTITLSRMAIEDNVPRNGASFLLAACRRELATRGWQFAVTYADPEVGHDGHVYRACGWTRAGSSYSAPRWVDNEGRLRSRRSAGNLSADEMRERGWVQKRGAPKPRYILDLR